MNNPTQCQSSSWYSKTATIGGIFWILYYVFDFAYGILENFTQYHIENSPALRLTGPAYFGGVVFVGITLFGIFLRLNNQYKALSFPALLIGGIATVTASIGLAGTIFSQLRIPFPQEVFNYIGPSVLPLFVSTILISIASLKARTLPAPVAYMILFFGLTTFPLGITLWQILTDLLPGYYYDELHFALAGCYWIMIGKALRRQVILKAVNA